MELPASPRLSVADLSAVFANTTNSYKFYWFLAILDELAETGQPRIAMRSLALRMVANVWYPLDYYKLSFGVDDGFKLIADFVSVHMQVDNRPAARPLFDQLQAGLGGDALAAVGQKVMGLLRYVPSRFIRPFLKAELGGVPETKVDKRIAELSQLSAAAPYRLGREAIELHPEWLAYLQEHQGILRAFTQWHLLRFLQKNNPNVIGLSEKLRRPTAADRNLKTATGYWGNFLAATPDFRCIYSGQPLTTATLSIDHFLPWSYVAHNQLWNLIPTSKTVNSAKNNALPDLERYLKPFVQWQSAVFQFHAAQGHYKLLEEYHLLFAQSVPAIQQQPAAWFEERLSQQIQPQHQTARNMGFAYPFRYGGA